MIHRALLALAATLLATTLHAQTVTLAGGGVIQPLVTLAADHSVGGLDVDSSGDLFYLDVDQSGTSTHLYERTAAGVSTDLYDIDAAGIYGVFVKVHGGQAFVSYASFSGTYTYLTGTLGGAGQKLQSTNSFTLSVASYDLAFNAAGTAFLSADPNGFSKGNHVYQFNTATGALVSKVSIPEGFSGPIAFDALSNLLYGTTSSDPGGPGTGIYRIGATTLADKEVTLAASDRLQLNGGNGFFAEGGGTLYDATYSSSLTGYLQDGAGSAFTEATASNGLLFSNLAYGAGRVYANVTDFGNGNYIFAIPEPAGGALLIIGAVLSVRRRRR